MATIITYDIPSRHREVKQAMFQRGYVESFYDNTGRLVYLPNTTLYHRTNSPNTVLNELKDVCLRLGVHLERCITTGLSNDWTGVYGEPFK